MSAPSRASRGEEGFTLIEALIAIVVLVIGLVAITNLMLVAATSNTIGNHSNSTTAAATEVMERVKSIEFNSLSAATGGDLDATPTCDDNVAANDCVRADNFQAIRDVPGVGRVHTTWEVVAVDGQTLFLRVRAESQGALTRRRTRAEFTTVRSCTSVLSGCPNP